MLLVDDSRAARMLIKSILTEYNENMELFEGENGVEAVDMFKTYDPDITFLDLTMPVMDGFEALRLIKQEKSDAVVVVLTADIQEKSVKRCMSAGAYMVMKKLPQKKIIFEVINEICELRSIK